MHGSLNWDIQETELRANQPPVGEVGWLNPTALAEKHLVMGCLLGDNRAWETMFSRYQPRLLSIIRPMLKGDRCDAQAEEIASAVWYSLCSRPLLLSKYNPHSGRLLTYLRSLARNEIWSRIRADRNRLSRECLAARSEAVTGETDRILLLQDFLSTLSPRERQFCISALMRLSATPATSNISKSNQWQLQHRVLKKFQQFSLRQLQ